MPSFARLAVCLVSTLPSVNPGPWGKHCLTAAHCAEKIASACGDMDVEKAYILGLELIPYILESGKEIVHFVSKQI